MFRGTKYTAFILVVASVATAVWLWAIVISLNRSLPPSTGLVKTENRTLPESKSENGIIFDQVTNGVNSATGKDFLGKKIRSYEGNRRFSSIRYDSDDEEHAPAEKKPHPFIHVRDIQCTKWNVVTTIFEPSEAVKRACNVRDWCTVIVADTKTPSNYMEQLEVDANTTNVVFLSVEEQRTWAADDTNNTSAIGKVVNAIPWRHFARKNLGFLFAIAHGAQLIFDFDDDNMLPLSSSLGDGQQATIPPLHDREILKKSAMVVTGPKAFNHHSLMGVSIGETSWPRGFPISQIHNDATKGRITIEGGHHRDLSIQREVGVFQLIADNNPDVDAIHRLVIGEVDKRTGEPIIFHRHVKNLPENKDPENANYYYDKITELSTQGSLVIPSHAFVPYNAQATIHTYKAMFALLLPSTVTGRVSDIWRSYFSQRMFRDIDTTGNGDSGDGLKVVILPPDVKHERNEHSLLADLQAENDLYAKSEALLEFLSKWEPNNDHEHSNEDDIPSRMEKLWIDLYERDYIQLEDVTMLQLWLSALAEIGYTFPKLQPPSRRRIKDVVLMGQFNFPSIADAESHNQQERNDLERVKTELLFWYQKWRQRFDTVVLRGPFPKYLVEDFRKNHEIDIKRTKKKLLIDEGFVSPMDNLLSTLKQYERHPKINGVLYVHDDMLVNVTNIFFGDGKGDNIPDRTSTILATHDNPSGLSFRIHPPSASTSSVGNNTGAVTELYYSMPNGFRSDNFTEFYEHLDYWEFNWLCLDKFTEVAKDPRSKPFLENDQDNDGDEPFLLVPTRYQSDFLYVPTSLTSQYEAIAKLLIDHEAFLECGLAKITDSLLGMPVSSPMRQQWKGQTVDSTNTLDGKAKDGVRLESVELCTSWDYNKVRGTTKMIAGCRSNTTSAPAAPYSVIHPFKLTLQGYMNWDRSFDWAIAGMSPSELSSN